MALDCFLDLAAVDPALFAGRTLYLFPAGPAAHQAYLVLAQALHQQRKGALARLLLGSRRQLALIRPVARLLVLHILHFPDQLRDPASLAANLRSVPIGAVESRLADALISAYSRPIRWAEYRDDTADQLAARVEAKLQGLPPEAVPVEETPIVNLLDALRQSVAACLHPQPRQLLQPRANNPVPGGHHDRTASTHARSPGRGPSMHPTISLK